MKRRLTLTRMGEIAAECRARAVEAAEELLPRWGIRGAGLEDLLISLRWLPVVISRRAPTTWAGVFLYPRGKGATARRDGSQISINRALCGTEERYRAVLLHELAHAIVAFSTSRALGHGPRWRAAMERIGQPVERELLITQGELERARAAA